MIWIIEFYFSVNLTLQMYNFTDALDVIMPKSSKNSNWNTQPNHQQNYKKVHNDPHISMHFPSATRNGQNPEWKFSMKSICLPEDIMCLLTTIGFELQEMGTKLCVHESHMFSGVTQAQITCHTLSSCTPGGTAMRSLLGHKWIQILSDSPAGRGLRLDLVAFWV